jgi:hypothetical protein
VYSFRGAVLVRFVVAGVAGVAAAGVWAGAASATPIVNEVQNGSFEQGLSNWTVVTGPGAANPGLGPQVIVTNGATNDGNGDTVPADNATTPDPDGPGTHSLYLVDDIATETLTQTIFLQPGIYEVGFDMLATGSGAGNRYDSSFSAVITGVTVVQASVSQIIAGEGVNTWAHYAANADISTAGDYSVAFTFVGGAAPAKDLMIDQVYVDTPSTLRTTPVNVPIPEPTSAALLGAGLAAMVLAGTRLTPARAVGRPAR